jgi:hemerythrin superfamily protein
MINLQTPEPLREEHQAFRDELLDAIRTKGELGKIAKQIDEILNPHFKMEEEFAFPPLSLMVPLSRGEIDPGMKQALGMIEHLKDELPMLTADHLKIVQKLKDFDNAVKIEKKIEFAQFSQKLIHHSRAEEGILYPAVILIGEYLSLKL